MPWPANQICIIESWQFHIGAIVFVLYCLAQTQILPLEAGTDPSYRDPLSMPCVWGEMHAKCPTMIREDGFKRHSICVECHGTTIQW